MEKREIIKRLMMGLVRATLFYAILIFGFIPKLRQDDIKYFKDYVYNICNEGIEGVIYYFDNFEIEATSGSEKLQIINEGLRDLDYLDLNKIQVSNQYSKIIFDGSQFKMYYKYNPFQYLKIKVDKDNMQNISCYEYEKCINYKNLIIGYLIFATVDCTSYLLSAEKKEVVEKKERCEDKKDTEKSKKTKRKT